MLGLSRVELVEEIGVQSGLISNNLILALSLIYSDFILSCGADPLFLVISCNLGLSLLFIPIALIFERTKWPQRFGLKLLGQILLVSLMRITLYQSLFTYGIKKTSAALASIVPNLAPGFVFITASIFRYERIDMKCFYTQIKIVGTLACIIGTILMSFKDHNDSGSVPQNILPNLIALDRERIIGTACLLGGVIILSLESILMTATLGSFPAPISFSSMKSFFGAISTMIIQLMTKHKLEIGSHVKKEYIIIFIILGSISGGVTNSVQAWAIQKKGPVFVNTFGPLLTVFTVILSAFTLGYDVTITGLAGMFIIFVGLYSVLWAKKKEIALVGNGDDDEERNVVAREPLLV